MLLCPQCKTEKMVIHSSTVYYFCQKCSHIAYDLPLSLTLPKSFDFSKLKVEGLFTLDIGVKQNGFSMSSSLPVILFSYGRTLLYLPEMSIKTLRSLSETLFQKVEEFLPFSFLRRDLDSNLKFSSIYYQHTNKLVPHYENEKSKKMYNLLTYNNRLHGKKYHIVYGTEQKGEKTYVGEHVYQKKDLVALSIKPYKNYRYVVCSEGNRHTSIDLRNSEILHITNLEHIEEITEDYIYGWNFKWVDDYPAYSHVVIRKCDKKILYKSPIPHDRGARLIGNRYFVDLSYQKGVLDLRTGKTISYPFANTCLDFVCDIDESGFTNAKGRHPLKDLPDIKWIGYDHETFFQKFNGFVPHPHCVGYLYLGGTGGYEEHDRKLFVVKSLSGGMFYKEGTKLVNIKTSERIEVDETLLKWVAVNKKVIVYEVKPTNTERISILQALENGKKIKGLSLKMGTLNCQNGYKPLKTNFLKREITFRKPIIRDVFYYPKKEIFEFICQVDGKQVTFESDKDFSTFDVAAIV